MIWRDCGGGDESRGENGWWEGGMEIWHELAYVARERTAMLARLLYLVLVVAGGVMR